MRNKIPAYIYQPRENGIFCIKDNARIIKEDGNRVVLHLSKLDEETNPLEIKQVFRNIKGKQILKLWNPQPGVYQAIEMNTNGVENPVIDETERREIVLDQEERFQRYKMKESFWMKYGRLIIGIIGTAVVLIASGVFLSILTKGVSNSIANVNAMVSPLESMVNAIEKMILKVGG
jgi:hypothetical protein